MKRFRIFIPALAILMAAALSAAGQTPTKFTLKGNIDYILESYDSGTVIESVALRQYPKMTLIGNGGGNISYYGVFDGIPQLAELVVDLTVPGGIGTTSLVFVLEEGTLVFDGKIVPHGGKLNNALRTLWEELPKMKEKDAVAAIREFVSKEENAPASLILLSGAIPFVGAENAYDLALGAPQQVTSQRAFKPVFAKLEAQALLARNQKSTDKGAMFKDFSVYYGGKLQSLSDYVGKGKYVLVDFWASWCGPCMQEIPNIVEVYKKYAGEQFDVLGVAVNDDPERSVGAVEKLQVPYPQIIGAGSQIPAIYGIQGIPHLILFAPDGTIVQRGMRGAQIEEAVKKALKLK